MLRGLAAAMIRFNLDDVSFKGCGHEQILSYSQLPDNDETSIQPNPPVRKYKTVSGLRNQRDAANQSLWDKVKRVCAGIKASFGDDSSQI
jgi:hypothetical protein